VHGRTVSQNRAAITSDVWIHPRLIDVTVKHLAPDATARQTDAIVETIEGRKVRNDENVVPFAFNPAMKDQHAIFVVHVHDAESLPAQSRMIPAQRDQFARKADVIDHLLVPRIEPGPVEKQILVKGEIV
jgi:hypothetical protein